MIYDIGKGFKKTSEAKFVASLRTRSSTFAIRTKATRNPKIAKELALFAPRMDTFCHLETIDYKTIEKINPAANNGSYAIGVLVVVQSASLVASFVSGDTDAASKSPTAHSRDRCASA